MSDPWADVQHVLKIDPDKDLVPGDTYADVMQCGTDAIEIGGTLDISAEDTREVIDACKTYDIPLYQEPSNPSVVIDDPSLAGYLIPIVLNAGEVSWITGAHKEWVRLDDVDWSRTTPEAYIVLNPDASVAQLTQANCDQTAEDVAAYAKVAERLFGQEIVYVEYSGTLGDPAKVQAAHDALASATLFYGGGIRDYDAAYEMGRVSDVIVVGDLLHDEGVDAVRETVRGVTDAHADRE